jgi:hypothetical protein
MNKELYFCLHLTESEHGVIEDRFEKFCVDNKLNLIYYRKLKEGHIPMYREIKIAGDQININKFKAYCREEHIFDDVEKNPHKIVF